MTRTARLLVSLVAGLTVFVTAVWAGWAAGAESNGGVRIMPLGDSITDGLTVPGGYRIDLWQKLVADGYTIDFVGSQSNGPASLGDRDHEGHSGWRIDQIDANIVGWLQRYTPRTILLHIGTNDMYQNPNGAATRLATLIDRITTTAPDAELFVATIIPLAGADATVRAFNSAIPGIVQSRADAGRRVHLVDMYSALTLADLADGVHPNAGGYSKMATVWYNALLSVPGSLDGGTSTPTPTTTSTPTTTPTPGPGGCTVTYQAVNIWSGGFQAEVTVYNNGSTALNGWTVHMTLAAGQSITNLWGGVNTGTSGAITVRNAPYNGTVAAGGTATFGFVANGDGSATLPHLSCTSP
ncbi:cellulose binding domain-containing protein [Thermostaphylospora chromogena]|uniref:GDSL-like Lipase/Acylhydrolase family protein n=1 Tax=Thermostaphylospora chromogena TaxID=35622 RepID=A0A1H1H909_9ACTN|nr:cellulose binding domain-containing protein [Thermostaphylospora chromogena]SDR21859.1 GDSL-like Lipase/Acylhydrolase family protein [Thermostaphylospora chromogena]